MMKKYFVKSYFNGWQEVKEEQYKRFVQNLRQGSTNIKQEAKDDFISSRTKIIFE